jgi:hypothetical protein
MYLVSKLRPALVELEEMRVSALRQVLISTVGFALLWSAVWFHYLPNAASIKPVIIGIVLAGSLSHWYFTRDLRRIFKDKVIRQFITLFGENFRYDPERHIDHDDYDTSGIFRTAYDNYQGDDYVEGRLDDTDLRFSEIKTTYTTGGKNRQTVTIFHGLFAIADFAKPFRGTTYVLPDVAESSFGWLGRQLQSANHSHGELIKMEDPAFEKLFVVYGSDQIQSRYILSTSLMERMTRYREKAGVKVSFAFKDARLYIAIHRNRNLFEPGLWRSYLEAGSLDSYINDLQLIMDVVDDLHLNLNIWSTDQRQAM